MQQKIARARRQALQPLPGATTLIAVSKQQPLEKIRAAIAAGHVDFGENYVQAAYEHWPALKQEFPHVRLHMIGHLQSNKAKEALALFDVIHTLASPSLVQKLGQWKQQTGRQPELLVQVNTGEEVQKSGVSPLVLPAFLHICRDAGLDIAGLMCIPPEQDDPRLHFALLQQLAAHDSLTTLSMGMSGDYEHAARMGAGYVRVGSAIFGARPART